MSFGNQQNGPTRINQVRMNQSVLGYALGVLLGKGKIQQAILWTDGFSWTTVSGQTNGSKGTGGKGGSQYSYSADVIAALCNGPIVGVGDVWSGQSWLSNSNTAETWTITGGTAYTPTNAANLSLDNGVSVATPVSGSFNDLGSSTPTVISGTTAVSLTPVAYTGGALAVNTYSVNPANGQYHFSSYNTGQTVTINYSYTLDYIKQQQIDIVPSSKTIDVGPTGGGGSTPTFYADGGVIYYASAGTSNPLNGTALTKVSGTPTATGTYSVSGTTPAVYQFAAGDIGQEVQITYKLNNSASLLTGVPSSLDFVLFEGTPGQAPWSLVTASYPGAALGYSNTAYVGYGPMQLGTGAQIQQNVFELLTADAWGGSIVDCNLVQCIGQVLTNPVWGLGAGAVPFPVSAIDNGTGGTWGAAKPAGLVLQDSTASSWSAANGYFISPVIDRQDSAAGLMSKWLEAGAVAAFMSEGLLKLVPYGDTSTSGNGAVWVAPSAFACSLDDTDFIVKGKGKNKDNDPVKISAPTDYLTAWNTVQVSWSNRSNQYSPEITPESDQASINRFGPRIEDPQQWDFITTLPAATFAASMRVKRNVYIRNTYEFTLSYRYTWLEPMDVVYITTSSSWAANRNNTNLNVASLPVRIIKTVDNVDGTIDVVCEDYPFGVHQPTVYNKGTSSSTNPPNSYTDPGETAVVLMDAPVDLNVYNSDTLFIGATGTSPSWGGCYVYASQDGTKYQQIGTIESRARLGTLAATFPLGSDPDSTHSLVVNLTAGSVGLESATTGDADQNNTLCYVDGELIAYSACAVTGVDQYTAGTYIRRGLMGTSISSHASGASFLRLDSAVFQYTYPSNWIGVPVYLKFQAFNNSGNAPQDLAACPAYTFTPGGTHYPAPPVVTITQSATNPTTATAQGAAVTTSASGLVTSAPVWLTVSWTWPTNFPTPTGFLVAIFTGSDPTNTSNYLVPVVTVGESARSYSIAVTPTTAMTVVNAAVEALYA